MKSKRVIVVIIATVLLIVAGIIVKKKVVEPKAAMKKSIEVLASIQASTPLMDGDIVFQNTKAPYGEYLKKTTESDYSHCAIILSENGKQYVYEAAEPGRKILLDEWIANGEDGRFVVKRLKNAAEIITPKNLAALKVELEKVLGKEYDYTFEWADNKAYSSEMVWKAYIRALDVKLCSFQSLSNFDISAPEVEKIFKARYTRIDIPYYELTVSPQVIFESDELMTVVKN